MIKGLIVSNYGVDEVVILSFPELKILEFKTNTQLDYDGRNMYALLSSQEIQTLTNALMLDVNKSTIEATIRILEQFKPVNKTITLPFDLLEYDIARLLVSKGYVVNSSHKFYSLAEANITNTNYQYLQLIEFDTKTNSIKPIEDLPKDKSYSYTGMNAMELNYLIEKKSKAPHYYERVIKC